MSESIDPTICRTRKDLNLPCRSCKYVDGCRKARMDDTYAKTMRQMKESYEHHKLEIKHSYDREKARKAEELEREAKREHKAEEEARRLMEKTKVIHKVDLNPKPTTKAKVVHRRPNRKKHYYTPEQWAVICDTSLSCYEVSKKTGMKPGTVLSARSRHGIRTRRSTMLEPPPPKERWKIWSDEEDKLLLTSNKSAKELAFELGRSAWSVHKRRGILRRKRKNE